MSFRKVPFTEIGVALPKADAEAAVAHEYLRVRGWNRKAIRANNLRWIDGTAVARHWPSAAEFKPAGGVVLPYPNDPNYCVVRVFCPEGTSEDAPKFLTPSGVPLKAFIPRSMRKDTHTPCLIIESPFKAALAASKGIHCIGVNGCHGCHEPGAYLPENPTAVQARAWFRQELLPYLLRSRTVMFITDADVLNNLGVRKAQLDFLDAAHAVGCKPLHRPIPDLGDGRTGIDDYLAVHSVDDFDELPIHTRKSRYVRVLRNPFMDRTEVGVADRFIAIHGADVRYDPEPGTWFSWGGQRWQPGSTPAYERMRATVATLKDEAAAEKDETRSAARLKFAAQFQTHSKITAALAIAAHDDRIRIETAAFDADCNLLGVQNGTLDLRAGRLLKPKREHMVTLCAPIAFDPRAKAPQFSGFIGTACKGDTALAALCQEVYGAVLLGRPDRQEVIFIYGPPGAGKTVFIEIPKDLLGDYAVATKASMLLRQRNDTNPEGPTPFLMALRGKRLATCSELPENTPLDETTVKDLSGGDMITARGHRKDAVEFRNTARILVRCNHLPVIAGTDKAIWTRILVVPFEHVLPASAVDKDFRAKVVAAEGAGILNWMLKGLRRYLARGNRFDVPQSVRTLLDKHRRESDVLGLWLDDCWDVDKNKTEPPHRTLQSLVTENYSRWCKANEHRPMSAKALWAKLRERFGYDPIAALDGGHKWALGFRYTGKEKPDTIYQQMDQTIEAQQAKINDLEDKLDAKDDGSYTSKVTAIDTARLKKLRRGRTA